MSTPPSLPALPPANAEVHTLPNGLRIVALPMPWRHTISLSVFVRTGSLHEPRSCSGLSHVVEHMAFKGTETRDCQRINLDAERLGAEVNAHTDKDHTAFHVEGLPGDLPAFVELLADIVLHSTFPADELERERQVILHELTDAEEDPVSIAFQLFDRASFGRHAAGRPVIGKRADIERLTREHLLRYVRERYSAGNVVVTAAGPIDLDALLPSVESAFGAMPAGAANEVPLAAWQGGLLTRAMAASSQCQLVLGFEAPPLLSDAHFAHVLAAAVLGEGMGSPLLDEIRERRGLAYHVACSTESLPWGGQFFIEAATAADQTDTLLEQVLLLLRRHAERIDEADVDRARRQLTVRTLRGLEQPARRLEQAAQDLFCLGRTRSPAECLEALHASDAGRLRDLFAQLLQGRPAIALAGSIRRPARTFAERLMTGT